MFSNTWDTSVDCQSLGLHRGCRADVTLKQFTQFIGGSVGISDSKFRMVTHLVNRISAEQACRDTMIISEN